MKYYRLKKDLPICLIKRKYQDNENTEICIYCFDKYNEFKNNCEKHIELLDNYLED
jgi:hypothetical protein